MKSLQKTFIIGLTTVFLSGCFGPESPESLQKRISDTAAVCGKREVEKMLDSPSTAKFPWKLNSVALDDGTYRVANYVDAQNTFGVTERMNYECTIKVIDADNFQCESYCSFL